MKPELHEDWIDSYAFKIVKNLQDGGFETYLVGGCVRDLLVGIHPKDFDIATSALPQQVRKKIPNSYVIGRRFRLVLVKRGDHQFEVATFRRNVTAEELADTESNIEGDNYFGTCEEDAQRRDFSVNALFYDPIRHQLLDFCNGLKDIESRILRMIGNPKDRFIEDPIRILRAVRLSHKINFVIDPEMRQAAVETAEELKKAVLPRRREEYLKFLRLPCATLAFMELFDLGILVQILPSLQNIYENAEKLEVFESYLHRMDAVGINKKEPIELFSAFLFTFLKAQIGEDRWDLVALEEDIRVSRFIRDEIGIFKQEAALFFHCMKLAQGLKKIDSYLRKGERRQSAFVMNDSFALALKLAQMDFFLSPQEAHFWEKQLERHKAGPQSSFQEEDESSEHSTEPSAD